MTVTFADLHKHTPDSDPPDGLGGHLPVLVSVGDRRVYFGWALAEDRADAEDRTVTLRRARVPLRWGTKNGVAELAETGPTSKSKVGARSDIHLSDVRVIRAVTPKAAEAWEKA